MYAQKEIIIKDGFDREDENYNGSVKTYVEDPKPQIMTIIPKDVKPVIDEVLNSAIVVKAQITPTTVKVAPKVNQKPDLTKITKADTNPPIELIDTNLSTSSIPVKTNSAIEDLIQKNPKYVTYGLVALLSGLTIALIKK